MKAETMNERPVFELLKQGDAFSFFHLQFPQWLLYDARYSKMCLEAKCVYMLLFNRCLLSKRNGWANENSEVFVIYTRQDLARILGIGEKRVTAAMCELKEMSLIWERRCGRGFANQIYLSRVKLSDDDVCAPKGGPLEPLPDDVKVSSVEGDDAPPPGAAAQIETWPDSPTARPAKLTGLDLSKGSASYQQSCMDSSHPKPGTTSADDPEPPEPLFKNRQNGGSKPAGTAVQDPPVPPPIYNDYREIDKDSRNQSQSRSSPPKPPQSQRKEKSDIDRRAEERLLELIIKNSEVEYIEPEKAQVIRDAIERLFYSETLNVQDAVYPKSAVRSNLLRLNIFIIERTLGKLAKNEEKIRNSSAYVKIVLFNSIMEVCSDLAVDPYLNFLNRDKSA